MNPGTMRLFNPFEFISDKIEEMMDGLGGMVSEAINDAISSICGSLYGGLYNLSSKVYDSTVDVYNLNFNVASSDLTKTPEQFNATAFSVARGIATSTILPVASVLLTIVFCWEMVQLVQNSNNGNNVTPEKLLLPLMKMSLCLIACSKGFDLITAIFRLGATVASSISGSVSGTLATMPAFDELGLIDPGTTTDPVTGDEMKWGFNHVLSGVGGILCMVIVFIAMLLSMIMIKLITYSWFIEIYVYASMVSIPMTTWMNREWSNMGMNYVRKILALSLRGVMMLIVYAIFGGVTAAALTSTTSGYMYKCAMLVGITILLFITLKRSSTIAESVVSAH